MKKNKQEIANKSVKELQTEIEKTVEEIAKMKLDAVVNPQKNTNSVFQKRKQLARLKTALSFKQKEV